MTSIRWKECQERICLVLDTSGCIKMFIKIWYTVSHLRHGETWWVHGECNRRLPSLADIFPTWSRFLSFPHCGVWSQASATDKISPPQMPCIVGRPGSGQKKSARVKSFSLLLLSTARLQVSRFCYVYWNPNGSFCGGYSVSWPFIRIILQRSF